MDLQQGREAVLAWQQAVDAAYVQQQASAANAPEPGLLESVGDGVEDLVNGAASLGQAALDNPAIVAEIAGGLAVAGAGAAVATGGLALDATGVGAVVGVPANVAGAGMFVAGGGLAFDGARRLADAASQNPVEPFQVNGIFGPSKEEKARQETEDIRDHQRRSHDAWEEQQKNLNKTPDDIPPLFRGQEKKGGWFW